MVARVLSVAVWSAAQCPKLWHGGQAHTVHSLLASGQKLWGEWACEARSATCMLSYLVNACDVFVTASVLGFTGDDRAAAAKWILAAAETSPSDVVLQGCQCLYLHCGNVFVARMRSPSRLIARSVAVTQLVSADKVGQHWLKSKSLQRFPMLLLGSAWELANAPDTAPWPVFSSNHYSVIAGPGQAASVGVTW